MSKSVLVVGSVALDDVETPFGKRDDSIGGSAVYFAIASSLYTQVRIVGIAGKDFPQFVLDKFTERKIDTLGLELVDGKTFRWGGKYHDDINIRDTLYTDLNVFADFKPIIPEKYKQTPYVFLGNILPSLQMDILNQLDKPEFVALDTMNLWIETAREDLAEVIRHIDLLVINDSELTLLTGELNLLKGLKKIHQRGLKYAIIKKGEHGAYLSRMNDESKNPELFFVPAYPVWEPIDPTGAGDSFAGGFMGYLSQTGEITFENMKKALVHAAIMGSLCVEGFSYDALDTMNQDILNDRLKALSKLVNV
ncbi:MAG: PfkB family carbohydrate kinase [Fidelibacterota bacterium]